MTPCPSCLRAACKLHPHHSQPGYIHHAPGCENGVKAMLRSHTASRPPKPALLSVSGPSRAATPPATVQASLGHFRATQPQPTAKPSLRAREVIRAHALAWSFGAQRLDSHGFNMIYFPHVGVGACRSLYTLSRALEGVRWPA